MNMISDMCVRIVKWFSRQRPTTDRRRAEQRPIIRVLGWFDWFTMHGIDTSWLPYCFIMLRFHDVTSIFLDWFVIWVDTKLRICQQSIKKLSHSNSSGRSGRIAQSMDARMRGGMLCRTVQMCKDVAGKTSQDLAATNWSLQLQQSQKTPTVDVPTCMLSVNFPLRRMINGETLEITAEA